MLYSRSLHKKILFYCQIQIFRLELSGLRPHVEEAVLKRSRLERLETNSAPLSLVFVMFLMAVSTNWESFSCRGCPYNKSRTLWVLCLGPLIFTNAHLTLEDTQGKSRGCFKT